MRNAHMRIGSAMSLLIALALTGGCASKAKPPPLLPPPAEVQLTHFTGTAISGPLSDAVDVGEPVQALAVQFSVIALENPSPDIGLPPLGAAARLIRASADGDAVRASTRLTLNTRLSIDADDSLVDALLSGQYGRAAPMRRIHGALPAGVTTLLTVAQTEGQRFFELAVSRRSSEPSPPTTTPASSSVELAVVLQDWVAAPADDSVSSEADMASPPARPPARKFLQHEIAVIDELSIDAPRKIALVVPFTFADSETQAVAVLIEIAPATEADPEHVQAMARCAEELQRSAQAVAAQAVARSQESDWPGLASALSAMSQPASRRAAMVFLADQTGAPICRDAALICDEMLLDQLSRTIVDRAASAKNDARTRQVLGWLLDYSALEFLSALASDNKLPVELSAVLLQHAGQVGREPSSIAEMIKAAGSKEDFDRRLTAENFLYLEDSSPAARVRAYDWLAARQAAPSDYDPLASDAQRRAALDRALQTPPTTTVTKGDAP